MRRTIPPRRGHAGMTLVETLAAVVMIALLTGVVAAGVTAAVHIRTQSAFASESQLVSDTINAALSDVLRYADDVETDGSGNVTAYTNAGYGVRGGTLCVGTGDGDRGMIYLNNSGSSGSILLLSGPSYSGLLVVPDAFDPTADSVGAAFDLRYSGGVFSGSYRLYDPVSGLLSDTVEFTFRALNG